MIRSSTVQISGSSSILNLSFIRRVYPMNIYFDHHHVFDHVSLYEFNMFSLLPYFDSDYCLTDQT